MGEKGWQKCWSKSTSSNLWFFSYFHELIFISLKTPIIFLILYDWSMRIVDCRPLFHLNEQVTPSSLFWNGFCLSLFLPPPLSLTPLPSISFFLSLSLPPSFPFLLIFEIIFFIQFSFIFRLVNTFGNRICEVIDIF